jgi:hypothetical protein
MLRAAVVLVLVAAIVAGCAGILGIQPPSYSVTVDNQTAAAITFAAGTDASILVDGTIAAGASGPILHHVGEPADDDPVFYGSLCTKVDLVALSAGKEVGRHAPGLCFGETWVIGAATPTQ